jgi:hypothetical protein
VPVGAFFPLIILYSIYTHDGKAYKKFFLWEDRDSSGFSKSKDEVLGGREQAVDDAGISCTGQVDHCFESLRTILLIVLL